ncbi:MAG: Protein phosphatase, partial [Chloroflexota bacterium]
MLNSFMKWFQRAPAAQAEPLRRKQAAAGGSAQLPAPVTFGQLLLGAAQSSGLQRKSNEDALFAKIEILGTRGQPAHSGLFVIADGVGGHRQGAQASALAV